MILAPELHVVGYHVDDYQDDLRCPPQRVPVLLAEPRHVQEWPHSKMYVRVGEEGPATRNCPCVGRTEEQVMITPKLRILRGRSDEWNKSSWAI
jgi:hypothetical protein